MRAAKQTLTVKGINRAKLKPGEKSREIPDTTPGLRLVISVNCKALSWRGKVKGGAQIRTTLCEWPQESDKQLGVLNKARAMALEYKEACRQKINPLAPSAEETRAEKQAVLSVGEIAEAFFKQMRFEITDPNSRRRSVAQTDEIEAMLRKRLAPIWERAYLGMKRADLQDITDGINAEGSPRAAGRLFESVKAMARSVAGLTEFEDFEAELESHPWATMRREKMKIQGKVSRDRTLSDDELKRVWQAAGEMAYPYGDCVRLLALTGARLNEAAEAQWSEFDLTAKTWTLPADRTKSNRAFIIPLSDAAVEILAALPRFVRDDDGPNYVFSTTAGAKSISGFSKFKSRLDKISKVTGWRIHDLRRVVRSGLSDLHVAEDVAELCLNHALRGLAKIYNRSDMVERRREALELWAARVLEIVGPAPDDSNVTRLDSRRKAVA